MRHKASTYYNLVHSFHLVTFNIKEILISSKVGYQMNFYFDFSLSVSLCLLLQNKSNVHFHKFRHSNFISLKTI